MLGELTKLLEQGYLTKDHVIPTPAGEYIFKIKTLSPKEESDARTAAEQKAKADGIGLDDARFYVYAAIEFVARCVETVNQAPLEEVPGAAGNTAFDKRLFVAQKFSTSILKSIWAEYNNLQDEAIKKFNPSDDEVKK